MRVLKSRASPYTQTQENILSLLGPHKGVVGRAYAWLTLWRWVTGEELPEPQVTPSFMPGSEGRDSILLEFLFQDRKADVYVGLETVRYAAHVSEMWPRKGSAESEESVLILYHWLRHGLVPEVWP